MTADATPGGEPQRSLRSLALPLASAGAARHAKTGLLSEQLSQASAQNLRFEQTAPVGRAPGLSSPHGGPSPPPATGPQHSLRSFALPLASAGAARHAKTGLLSEQLSQASAQNLRFEQTAPVGRAPGLSSPHGGPSPPPATGPQHSLRSFAPAQATDRKTAPPNSHCPRALRFILHSAYAEVVEPLLRRGARDLRGLRSRAAAQLRLR